MSYLVFSLLSVLHISEVISAGTGDLTTPTGNFYLGTEQVSRDKAVQLCDERSMELVSIQDADKNEAIFQLLNENGTNNAFWTSGQRHADEETWNWLDGEEIQYTNWWSGEPNGYKSDESCIEVFKKNSGLFWNDQPCRDMRGYICAPKKITEDFYVGTDMVSRDEAEQLCEDRSMVLVSIQTPEKNEAIFHLLRANGINDAVWTSGHKSSDGKNWTWLAGEGMEYTNWGSGEPNGARGNEGCIEVYKKESEVFWNDQPCEDKRRFICEKKQECETKLLSVTVDNRVCKVTEAPNKPTKKFYLSTQKATRPQALKHCSDMFMQLASLLDEDENTDLFELMRAQKTSSPYWLSGNRVNKGPWKWLNDEPITKFNWAKGEPNNKASNNACIEVSTSKTALLWNDHYCSRERFFVCEKLNPVVKITVRGNLTISHGIETNEDDACTVLVNTK